MTQQAETLEGRNARVRGYLVGQAAKLSPAAIVERVREAQAGVLAAAAAIPTGRLAQPPAAGAWSAQDVLAHLLAWSESCTVSIVGTLQRGVATPVAADVLEPAAIGLTQTAARARLTATREALFATVLAADPAARLDVIALRHFWFGPLNWKEALLFLRLHDLDHTGQLQAIAATLQRPAGARTGG